MEGRARPQPEQLTSLADRDNLSVAQAFGETFLDYMSRNPATGMEQRKAVFVKRVVTYSPDEGSIGLGMR